MNFETNLYIAGIFRPSTLGTTFDVINPATSDLLAKVSDSGEMDAKEAVNAAETGFEIWRKRTALERADILLKTAALLRLQQKEIAKIVTLENGKPLLESEREVDFAIGYLRWFAEEARRLNGTVVGTATSKKKWLVTKHPVGIVYAITPWNFPANMVLRKIAPALGAGCSVILKPAPETPLTALAIAHVFHEAGLPSGVLNVIPTSNAELVSKYILMQPSVRKITFTGSTQVGKLLMQQASYQLKHVAFELGGNAPLVIFPDCDLQKVIAEAIAIKFLRVGGQSCICANRILVHENIYEAFVEGFVSAARKLLVGNGLTPGMQIGPMINQKAATKLQTLVDDAVAKGAKLVLGNGAMEGNFFSPTVLVNVTANMLVYSQEIFGPIAAILPFKDEGEALKLANDSSYGLAAYLFTNDYRRMMYFADELHCGLLGINDASGYTHEVPFGGVKESGIGREGGQDGIESYLENKTVVLGDL